MIKSLSLSLVIAFLCLHKTYAVNISCSKYAARFFVAETHEKITRNLFNGNIIHGHAFSANSNRNAIYKVIIKNPKTGEQEKAVLKPRKYGDGYGFNRTPMEYVGYWFNLKLGMDYIPPSAYRDPAKGKGVWLNGQQMPESALIVWVEDSHLLFDVPYENWVLDSPYSEMDKKLFFSDVQIFDHGIMNSDRHRDNFMRGKHWGNGQYAPMLIDQAGGLNKNHYSWTFPQHQTIHEAPLYIRKSTYENLLIFNMKTLDEVSEFTSQQEREEWMGRIEEILGYFNNIIRLNGFAETVIDR